MNRTLLILGLTAAVSAGLLAYPQVTAAYRGDPSVTGPNYSQERHTAMEKAFADKDYTAWKNLMQNRGRVTRVINQDNFARFAQAHELSQQGKIQEAAQIRQELGLNLQNGSGMGQGMGRNCSR